MNDSNFSSLGDLGAVALSHRAEIEEVRRQIAVHHGYFDAWIYGFLENKKFNIDETVAKLHRRFAMEKTDIANLELTDFMRESLRRGTIQEIGHDKQGRSVLYVTTHRDKPQASRRDEQRRCFDMFVSYATRLRRDNMRCQAVMLINQEKASMWSNLDMTFQADIALRISKFYPGAIDKMYICKMGRTLAAMAKPIFRTLPSIVSDRLQIIDDGDIKNGLLLDLIDESVLPVALGGKNDCDDATHWNAFADRVENYYVEVKRALVERGMTMKEWELEQLGISSSGGVVNEPASEARSMSVSLRTYSQSLHQGRPAGRSAILADRLPSRRITSLADTPAFDDDAADADELGNLKTCLSEREQMPLYYPITSSEAAEQTMTWSAIMSPLPRHFAVFFLEELLRCHDEVEAQESEEWAKLVKEYAVARYAAGQVKGLDTGDVRWYAMVPYPLRELYRLVLRGILFINAIYFIGALVFVALLVANITVTLFFGFHVRASYFFPLNCVLVNVMLQGSALCGRTLDIVLALSEGRVIPLFERLGSYRGVIAEVLLFGLLVAVQFIIFCIYAKRDCPLRGLQVAFATGWLSAVFIAACSHALFFTGLCMSRTSHADENRWATLPFLIALRPPEYKNGAFGVVLIRTSSILICGFPVTVSILLGTGFLLSHIMALFACTLAASMVAAFCVSFYADAVSNSLSGSLLRLTLWMMTTAWLYVTFTFGFRTLERHWTASVIVAAVLNGLFVIMAYICAQRPDDRWLLRASFIVVLLYILGSWITIFPLLQYKLALFCLALMIHNLLTIVLARRTLMTINAVFFVSAAVLLLALSCVLLGWYGTTLQYLTPQSGFGFTPASAVAPASRATTSSPLAHHTVQVRTAFRQYPVCHVRLGADASFTVADLSLLTEVTMARSEAVLRHDFEVWFAGRSITYNGIATRFESDDVSWELHSFSTAAAANTTFYVLNNRFAKSSIVGLVGWIDAIALSPLSIFLPWDWTINFVWVISFMTRLIDFQWRTLVPSVADFVANERVTRGTQVVLSGFGVAGGMAAAAAAQAEVQAVVFSAPGLLHVLRKFDVTLEAYHRFVLGVGAYYSALGNVGGQDFMQYQKLLCKGNVEYCLSQQFISNELLTACGDEYERQHVAMSSV